MGHGHQALPIFFLGYICMVECHPRGQSGGDSAAAFIIDVGNDHVCTLVGKTGGNAFTVS
jgi:hypothetical protein